MNTLASRPRPLVLCILDGFGERVETDYNAVRLAKTPNLKAILEQYPSTLIGTSGPDVGLPPGQMGNSEVGHLNFGAGRIAMMDISRIDVAIAEKTLAKNTVIAEKFAQAKERSSRLHLLGLVSDGGVHSSLEHLFALIEAARDSHVSVVVHAFLDGRDTAPKSALKYLAPLQEKLRGVGVIGTVSGRYYAMDRDKRWDRVKRAWDAIVLGHAPRATDALSAVKASYDAAKTDEFVEPVCVADYSGLHMQKGDVWVGQEVALGFNFRPDRMREISGMLTSRLVPEDVLLQLVHEGTRVHAFDESNYACMTQYDEALQLPVAFPKEVVANSFGEIISKRGLSQLRCAETEKYAHVRYFFSGGREAPFEREDRKLVPSPRDVKTYDQKPEMSASQVADEVVSAIESDRYDFILVNFANPDMVGHTGDLSAAILAVESVDKGIERIWKEVKVKQGVMMITADHGNCETMRDAEGNPHTAHTTNPVPFVLLGVSQPVKLRQGGRICDVAPTMLELLGISQPSVMTGKSLLVKND